MTSTLNAFLESWEADITAARGMAALLGQLGLSEEALPSDHALRAACLAMQADGAGERLRQSLIPHEETLSEYGVVHAGRRIATMESGALSVIYTAMDRLYLIKEQLDSMLTRAYGFVRPNVTVKGRPEIRTGARTVNGYRHQRVNITVSLKDADRLLIHHEKPGVSRVLTLPGETLRVTVPLIQGRLLLYAENATGGDIRWMTFREVGYA